MILFEIIFKFYQIGVKRANNKDPNDNPMQSGGIIVAIATVPITPLIK